MGISRPRRLLVGYLFSVFLVSTGARAQEARDALPTGDGLHEQMTMDMPAASGWQFMQDGVVFAEYNHQGGPRGGDEFIAPNWWMGMASRDTSHGRLTFTGMLSLDPVTVGRDGYRELFQSGEALDGRPLIDRQHPHDLFMQLAAVWRIPVGDATGFTIAGGPVGEPALGPVAFMHRASALDNPTAPLGHHTLDSTHISFGVVTVAVDHGPIVIEGSVFNGREPDDNRWDFDFGPLDSFSGRIWYRPTAQWEFQISSGRLKDPEELEPGNLVRSTASAQWTRQAGAKLSSVTIGYGRNDSDHGARSAFFVEGAHRAGPNVVYSRFEALQVETALLLTGVLTAGDPAGVRDPLAALTLGGTRDVLKVGGIEGAFGADVTFYGVSAALRSAYTSHPVSFHVFFRLRPPAGAMGRMLNMRMSRPMGAN
jgi:hypothetical protein